MLVTAHHHIWPTYSDTCKLLPVHAKLYCDNGKESVINKVLDGSTYQG